MSSLLGTYPTYSQSSVAAQMKRAAWLWRAWFALVIAFCGLLVAVLVRFQPSAGTIAWLLYFLGVAVIVRQPRHGVYLILFLALASDTLLVPWYPFTKNFSSHESLLFVSDAAIVSPLETYLVLTVVAWLGKTGLQRRLTFHRGTLFWPMLLFAGFLVFGLLYGVTRGGANSNVALWEARPLFYLILMYLLTSNLVEEEAHVSSLVWFVALALFLEGVIGVNHVVFTLRGYVDSVQGITDHSAAVHMNTVFILAIAVWMYKGSALKRLIIPLLVPAVLVTYVATQRRAAFVALALAFAFLLVCLYKENRKALFVVLPPLSVLLLAYLAAFWNATSALGVPAQAIKSVIAPGQLSYADQASNVYRILENINIQATIHAAPLFGIGFGHKFYQVVGLPDISWFTWWEYITHNSILWLWMKMGVFGFAAAMYLIAMALMRGAEQLHRLPTGELKVATFLATTYIAMHALFTYVDMGWDTQSGLYLGMALGLISAMPKLARDQAPSAAGSLFRRASRQGETVLRPSGGYR